MEIETRIMDESIFNNTGRELCVICSLPVAIIGRMTCSEKCHDEFVKLLEKKFGITKKVTDITTGISYKVPTREIIEKGLEWRVLTKYPVWKEMGE